MKRNFPRNRRPNSFTLVELLVVLAIIALLGGLMQPALRSSIRSAQSVKCIANLRTIGIAASLAATDNNNTYPQIDQAGAPIYQPPGSVGGLVAVLSPYGISTNIIQCPTDMGTSPSSFSLYGSSYEWDPVFDDENPSILVVYGRPTTQGGKPTPFPVNSSRVRLCYDFVGCHRGKIQSDGTVFMTRNVLFGDGHVSSSNNH